jgi:hypothetical protein
MQLIFFNLIFWFRIRDRGSEIQNPRFEIRDGKKSGSGINIQDSQHCEGLFLFMAFVT